MPRAPTSPPDGAFSGEKAPPAGCLFREKAPEGGQRWACQRPCQRAARFSLKAVAPSRASSDERTGSLISRCRSSRSAAGQSGRLDEDPLRRRDGERPVGGDRRRQAQCLVERAALRRDPVDQPDLVAALRRDQLTGQGPLHREVVRHPLGEPEQPAARGDQSALDLGQPELRVLGGDEHVAGQRDLEPAGDGIALQCRDDRLDRRLLDDARETPAGDRGPLAGEERLEVHAGAERAAGAGDDPGDQRAVVVEAVHRLADRHGGLGVDRVPGLGPVDGDDQDALDDVGEDRVAHGRGPMRTAPSSRIVSPLR